MLSLMVGHYDGGALGSNPLDQSRMGAPGGGEWSSKSNAPVGSTDKDGGQANVDLATITRVAHKGRIQDKEYNPSIKAVDELIGMGVEAVPFLINRLDDDRRIDHHVLDFWSYVTVGDLSLVILTDLLTDPTWTETTVPGTSWSEILYIPRTETDTTAEEELTAFVSTNGRAAIKAKWERIWQSYIDRLYWDDGGRCFRTSAATQVLSDAPARKRPQGVQRSDGRVDLTSYQIRAPVLVQVLNYGQVRELKPEADAPGQQLRLRLFAIPKEGDCVQDSHYVCSHHYYLAASAYEEGVGEAVYDLGEVGEIREIRWLKSDESLTALLGLTVTNYPRDRFKGNRSLPRKERKYRLRVALDRLSVLPERSH